MWGGGARLAGDPEAFGGKYHRNRGTAACPLPTPQTASDVGRRPVLGSAVLQRHGKWKGPGERNISNEGAWGINLPEKIKGAKSTQLC